MKRINKIPKNFVGGWSPSPRDDRDFIYSAYQPLGAIPEKYKDEVMVNQLLKYVHNQGQQPSCVAESGSKIQVYQEYKEGIEDDFSVRFLYSIAKKLDEWNGDGTYLRTMSKVMVNQGAPVEKVYLTDYSLSKDEFKDWTKIPQEVFDKAMIYADKSYAVIFPSYTDKEGSFQLIKQAIYLNGIAMAGFWGDNQGWQTAHIKLPKVNAWGHSVPLIYYDKDYIYFLNSWGKDWGNGGIGYFDKSYLPGEVWTFIDKLNKPNNVEFMKFVRTISSSTVYILNDITMTAKPILQGSDYVAITDDKDFKQVKVIEQNVLNKYQIVGTICSCLRK